MKEQSGRTGFREARVELTPGCKPQKHLGGCSAEGGLDGRAMKMV